MPCILESRGSITCGRRDAVGKRRSLDELHDQRPHGTGLFETVNRGDVRVIQRRQDVSFALKSGQSIDIMQE
jgi:hypothetical protein